MGDLQDSTFISDTGKKMDQPTYLSQTLWQFLEASAFTDLTLVCKDGEVAVHSPMLASLLLKIGFSCLSADQERPECLLMPDSRSHSCYHSSSIFLCFAHVIHCIGETVKVLYNVFVVISLNPVHHQHFHRFHFHFHKLGSSKHNLFNSQSKVNR